MNFNFGGFNESLKYSYQQFCKNDAEAREKNRLLLLRLDRFENKSQELSSNTQIAAEMKNQYERRLMQENPLLWSQIQRSLAILDYPEINQHLPPAIIHHQVPAYTSNTTQRQTREMAINTSNSSHSSASEQPSLHEDGVWAHSPSPMPDVQTSFANMKIPNVDHHHQPNNRTATAVASHITTPTKSVLPTSTIPPPPSNIPDSPAEIKSHQFPFQMTRFSPVSSSTPNFNQNKPPPTIPIEEKFEQLQEPADNEPEEKTKSSENELLETAGNTETLPMNNEPVAAAVESPKPSVIPAIKPFRLDSESEGASEGGGFSGPPTHNAADEDSDSFWN